MSAAGTNDKSIRVVELFAGVGGFRVGLERCSPRFKTVWANQWEPSTSAQHAFECYKYHYGNREEYVNKDIALVKQAAPLHDLLVGGFPCQDYSVARTGAKGITGKKGVLWWDINDILIARRPPFVLLENVDRLIKSPANQRGRDFGIMLRCFYDLGYAVEWRVINAAEYGNAQRRRRVYIFAFHKTTSFYKKLKSNFSKKGDTFLNNWLKESGFYAPVFPVLNKNIIKNSETWLDEITFTDLESVSDFFTLNFYNSGVMVNGRIFSLEQIPCTEEAQTLRMIRENGRVEESLFLGSDLQKWNYLKGAKRVPRVKPNGEPYYFSEGSMVFPDDLDLPSRTMLTSESSVNRSTHVIEDYCTGKLRLLTPIECERLNGFSDNWTNTGMPKKARYFMMGNALVVPIISRIAQRILTII